MQIMLKRLAPENELRYVIGVIQQYIGVIHATDLLNNVGVNTSEQTTLRRSEFLPIDYNKNCGLTKVSDSILRRSFFLPEFY